MKVAVLRLNFAQNFRSLAELIQQGVTAPVRVPWH